MATFKKTIRRIGILLVGVPLLVVGLILIPLPGPGVLVCFIAFSILSLEFEWANKRLVIVREQLKAIYKSAKARADKIENWQPPKNKK